MVEIDPMAAGEQETTYLVKTTLCDERNPSKTGMPFDTGLERNRQFDTEPEALACAHALVLNYEHIYDTLDEHQTIDATIMTNTGDTVGTLSAP